MSRRSTPLGASSTPWSSSRDRSSRVRRPAPVCTAGSTWSLAPMRKRHRIWWRSFRVIWESWTWSKDTGMVPTSYWVSTSFSSRVNSSWSSAVSPRVSANWSMTEHSSSQSWPYSWACWSSPRASSSAVRSSSRPGRSISVRKAQRASSFPAALSRSFNPRARRPRGPPTLARMALISRRASASSGVKSSFHPAGLAVQSSSRTHMAPWTSQAMT